MVPDAAAGGQLHLDLSFDPGATFASFHAEGNEFAVQLLAELAAGGEQRQVLLYGARGAGKTHLLHAVCAQVAARTEPLTYLPLGQFRDAEPGAVLAGLERLRTVCLDDLDQVLGNADWERALFDLLNRLRACGTHLALAARPNPVQRQTRLADLASRLAWGPVVQLHLLRDEALGRALRHRARTLGLDLSDQSLAYIQTRGPRVTGKLFRFLARLDSVSLAEQRRLTLPLVRRLLREPEAG